MTDTVLEPTQLDLSGERLTISYQLTGDETQARAAADQIIVEQTIEFPLELVPDDDIRAEIVAKEVRFDELTPRSYDFAASFAVEVVGGQLPQLLNVLFGNISMVPGIRVTGIDLPTSLLARFPGPQHGIDGLRQRFGTDGPLLATALKPMGTPVPQLAEFARALAAAGMHLIKDDHSFATQPFCDFRERVNAIAQAVGEANGGGMYLPSLNVPVEDLTSAIDFALEAGVGGFLVLPGLCGFDTMRSISATTPADTVIMAHPAMLGAFVTDETSGIAHDIMFGTLARLAGADVSVYPNFGGRFSFAPEACAAIATACREPLEHIRPAWPSPAGGMSPERVPEMLEFYGPDTCLLVGGALYRGDIGKQVARMRAAVEGT